MAEITLCERRTTCALNDAGKCTLPAPRLEKKEAYTNCLDQIKPVA